MCGRSFLALSVAVCALLAPSAAMAGEGDYEPGAGDAKSSLQGGDYEPGASAPAFTGPLGNDQGVGLPEVPMTELPFTGIPIFLVFLVGMILVSMGVLFRRLGGREF
jgi:hypothetical protein